ncbi:GlsB/YeaQ/YmgE family stress response membrane protein [Litorihabitans aurantiacus]|uniref:Transglycosylase n=1 Tax=Litorihabitans aurantiacus TaxID=1930061 RepID=A0AA37UTH7_9MICO|nr:GlsB/YeaQ/YmgE family stress response membrane protein [Litorihabitans aurantiacus]GMA30237.1 transglycosylase [Litorihabitans aurantiacus]
MGIIGWIVLGLIAGAIAKAILKDRAPGGFLATLILGVVGALVGGFLGNLIFDAGLENFFSIQTWALAIGGSLVVLLVYGALTGRKGARR